MIDTSSSLKDRGENVQYIVESQQTRMELYAAVRWRGNTPHLKADIFSLSTVTMMTALNPNGYAQAMLLISNNPQQPTT